MTFIPVLAATEPYSTSILHTYSTSTVPYTLQVKYLLYKYICRQILNNIDWYTLLKLKRIRSKIGLDPQYGSAGATFFDSRNGCFGKTSKATPPPPPPPPRAVPILILMHAFCMFYDLLIVCCFTFYFPSIFPRLPFSSAFPPFKSIL
jgi:hypothetical protein